MIRNHEIKSCDFNITEFIFNYLTMPYWFLTFKRIKELSNLTWHIQLEPIKSGDIFTHNTYLSYSYLINSDYHISHFVYICLINFPKFFIIYFKSSLDSSVNICAAAFFIPTSS